jgi:hypothetical protein
MALTAVRLLLLLPGCSHAALDPCAQQCTVHSDHRTRPLRRRFSIRICVKKAVGTESTYLCTLPIHLPPLATVLAPHPTSNGNTPGSDLPPPAPGSSGR